MRPVIKAPVIRANGTQRKYRKYTAAKPELIDNLGCYCSYCEIFSQEAHLEVEHVLCKKEHPGQKLSWDNFLLSCKVCNAIKGIKDLAKEDVYLPHSANTFRMISVLEGGAIIVNPALNDPEMIAKAQRTIELTGQDRIEIHEARSKSDDRWQHRRMAWRSAMRYLGEWEKEERIITPEQILNIATGRGCWSVWMFVFREHPEVQEAFLKDTEHFKGTATFCFDNQCTPINRNGADL